MNYHKMTLVMYAMLDVLIIDMNLYERNANFQSRVYC